MLEAQSTNIQELPISPIEQNRISVSKGGQGQVNNPNKENQNNLKTLKGLDSESFITETVTHDQLQQNLQENGGQTNQLIRKKYQEINSQGSIPAAKSLYAGPYQTKLSKNIVHNGFSTHQGISKGNVQNLNNQKTVKDSGDIVRMSQTGESGFANQPRVQSSQKSTNVIDLEVDHLTFKQTRLIKQQVQQDCQLLRNRVRMLQMEMQRARKKIEETKKKTLDIKLIKERNDVKFQQKLEIEQKKNQQQHSPINMEKRLKQTQDIKEKRYQLFLEKKKEAEDFKLERTKLKEQANNFKQEIELQNQQRKELIRYQQEEGIRKKREFMQQKMLNALREKDYQLESQRKDIYSLEKEAEELEKMEADLLKQLQLTQQRETDAFGQLKTALIDSSLPKAVRLGSIGDAKWLKEESQASIAPISRGFKSEPTNQTISKVKASKES